MFGFLVNAGAVAIGSVIGLLFRKVVKKEYCDSVLKIMGVAVLIIGALGVIENTISISIDGSVSFNGTMLLIISLAIGMFIGELLKIDTRLTNFSVKIEQKLKRGNISEGFLGATLIYCVGAMTIVGSLNDTLGDPQMIYIKSLLDGITSIVLASTLGFGVLLSAIAVLVIQGVLTLGFALVGQSLNINDHMELIKYLGMVGNAMVLMIGLNFVMTNKIKVANTLPALLIPIVYYLVTLWIK